MASSSCESKTGRGLGTRRQEATIFPTCRHRFGNHEGAFEETVLGQLLQMCPHPGFPLALGFSAQHDDDLSLADEYVLLKLAEKAQVLVAVLQVVLDLDDDLRPRTELGLELNEDVRAAFSHRMLGAEATVWESVSEEFRERFLTGLLIEARPRRPLLHRLHHVQRVQFESSHEAEPIPMFSD